MMGLDLLFDFDLPVGAVGIWAGCKMGRVL